MQSDTQSENQWKIEAVLMLGAGLMVSLSAGALLTIGMREFLPAPNPSHQKFLNFIIISVSFQIVGLILTHFFLKEHVVTWAQFLGLNNPNLKRAVLIALAVFAVALPLTLGLNSLSAAVLTHLSGPPEAQPTMQVLEASVSLAQRICFGAAAILLAPVLEEILFRGVLYRTLQQRGYPKAALFGSAVLFAAIHGSWVTLLPLTVLAIILALLYDKADNLLAPILVHSLFNAANFFLYLNQAEIERWWKQLSF